MFRRSFTGYRKASLAFRFKAALLVMATMSVTCLSAGAGVVFSVYEVGSDIKINVSGSIDTTGWSLQGIQSPNVYIRGRNVGVGSSQMQRIDSSGLATSGGASTTRVFPPLGDGIHFPVAGTATGNTVIFQTSDSGTAWALFLPANYVSGSSLSGSATYANLSFASLGMTSTTVWKWFLDGNSSNNDKSITVAATVPEPSGVAFGALAIALIAGGRRLARLRKNAHA